MDRSLLSTALFVSLLFMSSKVSAETAFPFSIVRDRTGQLERIELPKSLRTDGDLLQALRAAHANRKFADSLDINDDGLSSPEEKAALAEAMTNISEGLTKRDLDDPRLDGEFAKARAKLDELFAYRLLAAPNDIAAFDQENAISEAVEQILDAAKLIFDVAPPFKVFEFLVDQHLEALESRREFHQNRLLVFLDDTTVSFSAPERSLLRSSIYYSRIWIADTPARKKARAAWTSFGDTVHHATLAKCKGFLGKKEYGFGSCFKVQGKEIRNRLVGRNIVSKSTPSLAFDYDSTSRVRNSRVGWMLLKLGLKFVPAPLVVKKAVSRWIGSHYVNQRRVEGLLYESARQQKNDNLAGWIAYGSANPLLTRF